VDLAQDRRARPCFSSSHSPRPNSLNPVPSITFSPAPAS
jgi:hypothetical protein